MFPTLNAGTDLVASISSCNSKYGPTYLCGTSAPVDRQLSLWISTSLKQTWNSHSKPTDTFPRVTTASGKSLYQRSPRDCHRSPFRTSVGFPVPGCLAHGLLVPSFFFFRRTVVLAGYTRLHSSSRLLLTPLMRLGSSFPADFAKPVPLAVVSLDSR